MATSLFLAAILRPLEWDMQWKSFYRRRCAERATSLVTRHNGCQGEHTKRVALVPEIGGGGENLAILTDSPIFVASNLLGVAAIGRGGYENLETQLREGTTVGAATISSEARAAWQRTLEVLTGEDP